MFSQVFNLEFVKHVIFSAVLILLHKYFDFICLTDKHDNYAGIVYMTLSDPSGVACVPYLPYIFRHFKIIILFFVRIFKKI